MFHRPPSWIWGKERERIKEGRRENRIEWEGEKESRKGEGKGGRGRVRGKGGISSMKPREIDASKCLEPSEDASRSRPGT